MKRVTRSSARDASFNVENVKKCPKLEDKSEAGGSRDQQAGQTESMESRGTKKPVSKDKLRVAATSANNEVKTVKIKGHAAVDTECSMAETAHVYVEGSNKWDAMLNQTNLQHNNNKFYLMQLLQDEMKNFSVWFRWGRVGKRGQSSLVTCGLDLDQAKAAFCKKFLEKTKNCWDDRDVFEKVPGKYDLLKIDMKVEDESILKQLDSLKPITIPDSKLDQQIQEFIKKICDVKSMEDTVIEMQYDTKKSPLGKLTQEQITSGYQALKIIEKLVKKKDFGGKLLQACNDFYTRIPHNFGMKRPPLISTEDEIHTKLQLLEALGDIEIALKILSAPSNIVENPVDRQYRLLECDLTILEKTSEEYNFIRTYLRNTHAPTHNTYRMEIINIFQCCKAAEDHFVDYGNKMLLWHGSRMINWASIVGKGLRIAPPEAPHTGYMFGKGVYFADMSSKSANYCYPSRKNNTGVLLVCEVSLGNWHELLDGDINADNLPDGKHSVKGMGQMIPDPKKHVTLGNGTVVPQGKGIETDVKNANGFTLNYNEYVVYNTKQIRMKYIVQVKFNFK